MRVVWAVAAVVAAAALVALRRRVFVVRVRGLSMSPTYGDGERIVMVRSARVRRGDVVAFRPPAAAGNGGPAVKRVAGLAGDTPAGEPVPPGQVFLTGDAGRSLDSTVYGPVPLDHVIGRAVRPRPAWTPPAPLGPAEGDARPAPPSDRAQDRPGELPDPA
ncbi:MAG TPA: S26 family signal peptidase [Pseudonocardiaceae bacterium]